MDISLLNMIALYIASVSKNSPNNLQLMVDASACDQLIFTNNAIVGFLDDSSNQLPTC